MLQYYDEKTFQFYKYDNINLKTWNMRTICWCLRSFVIWVPFSSILMTNLSSSFCRSCLCVDCWVASISPTNSWYSLRKAGNHKLTEGLTNLLDFSHISIRENNTTLCWSFLANDHVTAMKAAKKTQKKQWKDMEWLTSSFVPARPAEPKAGPTVSPVADALDQSLRHAHEDVREMKEKLFEGSSWFHVQICAEPWPVHTAAAGDASSCEVCFACWRGLSGSGLLTGLTTKQHVQWGNCRLTWSSLLERTVLTVPVMKGIFWCLGPIGEHISDSDFWGKRQEESQTCWTLNTQYRM